METKTTAIARINNVEIVMIENDEKRVAIKPICEALGITMQGQLEVLKNHPIYSSTVRMILTVGGDGKQREMVTIPYEFVFGWLSNIDSRKVNEANREALLRYQLECIHALYNYFTEPIEYLKYRQARMQESFEKQHLARANFSTAKNQLTEANDDFKKWMTYTQKDYKSESAQMKLDFGKEAEG